MVRRSVPQGDGLGRSPPNESDTLKAFGWSHSGPTISQAQSSAMQKNVSPKNFSLKNFLKMVTKRAVVFALVVGLVFSQAAPAFAARSGGRAGGFRAPSPSRTVPRGGGGSYGGGYGRGYGGGGFGFPFMLPFFFGGGGGLFSLLVFMAVASILVRAFQNFAGGSGGYSGAGYTSSENPAVSVAKIQVGLLAQARELQPDLDRIAQTSNTSTNEGLSGLLQESVLALLRHPEYWAYGSTSVEKTVLTQAETVFNRVALGERSKLAAETLSNYNGQVRSLERSLQISGEGSGGPLAGLQEPGEYIVVTLVLASQGKLELPQVQNADDLRSALRKAGAISSDQLYGMELLWEPQAKGDVLSADELMAEYPDLRIVA